LACIDTVAGDEAHANTPLTLLASPTRSPCARHREPPTLVVACPGASPVSGIVGLVRADHAPVAASVIVAMRDSLAHRGPDDAGLYVASPAPSPAHCGGGEHARLGLHADGGTARLDSHVELASVPPVLKDHWRLVEAGAASSGRPANRSQWRIARDVLVGPTPAAARERARETLGRNYLRHQQPNRIATIQMTSTKLEPSMPDEAVTVDYLMDNVWIVGDPSQCVEQIHQLHEESGGFGTLLSITTDSDDAGWDHASSRPLMEQVAPRVAHLG
jgi:alkanesulfonate monooxygenase SsuD/methylene tetrahydromethanopterin reductase-like flavin-dependent oxidoreductase (luciferase family)